MPEHDLTRTDRMALYIRARADAKAARDSRCLLIGKSGRVLAPCTNEGFRRGCPGYGPPLR